MCTINGMAFRASPCILFIQADIKPVNCEKPDVKQTQSTAYSVSTKK